MTLVAVLVFLGGLVLGTLLNVVVIRLPREQHVGGWLHCTRCGQALAFWQIVPLAGWLLQGGRGRCCGRRIDWVFPLVELLSGVILTIFYLRYGFTGTFFYLVFVTTVLLVTGAIDWLHRSIYTFFVLVPALLAIGSSFFVQGHSFPNAIVGALVSGFVFVLLFVLARMLFPGKAAPFGLGDVYLGIFIGAAVGFIGLVPALFYGILLAGIFSAVLIILRRAGRPNIPEYISYGTFLCLGTLGYLLIFGLGNA